MGRGLSDLQKWILRAAQDNRRREFRYEYSHGPDLLIAEIKAGYFHFPTRQFFDVVERRYRAIEPDRLRDGVRETRSFVEVREDPRNKHGALIHYLNCLEKPFHSAQIPNYAAAAASISRALTRLHRRGLILFPRGHLWHGCGISLTPAGIELARTLPGVEMVNTVVACDSINPCREPGA
jgi:hypothetical protein